MRTPLLVSLVSLGTVGSLVVAAPAIAATVPADVTDVVVVHTTAENFYYAGPYTPWEPEGPAVFPSIVDSGEGDGYVLQAYEPVVAEDCVFEISSFSVDVEALDVVLSPESGPVESGFFVGFPAGTVDGTTAEFEGTGTVANNSTYVTVENVDGELDGTLTLTLPEPITIADTAFGWLGLYTTSEAEGPLWQINSVSYQGEMTCPDPAPVPSPTTTPAPVAALAATGSELPLLTVLGGVSLLAVGGALVFIRLRRARAQS